MQVKIPGHRYRLSNLDSKDTFQELQFIHKAVDDNGNFKTIQDGTTLEEVIEMLLDRLSYLQRKVGCRENAIAITKLEEALMWLNKRTTDRLKRGVEGTPIK